MKYSQLLAFLKKRRKLKEKWGLKNIQRLLSLLGSPQNGFRIINVTGTNGKGSTTAMIASCLAQAGFKTGSYFSPHVDGFQERIQVNGKKISKQDAARAFEALKPLLSKFSSDPLSFFEVVTAIALLYFSRKRVAYAVLEAGLGGRLDATNTGSQSACVITNVSLEHTQMLGNSIASIAGEKAALLHPHSALFTSEKNPSALAVFKKACKKTNSKLFQVKASAPLSSSRLKGPYQASNSALASAVCAYLGLPKKAISAGIRMAFLPARFETMRRSPLVIHDCAHNPAAAGILASAVRQTPHKKCIVLIGAMADKDVKGVLRALAPVTDVFICNQPKVERALGVKALASLARATGKPVFAIRDVRASMRKALSLAGRNDLILATGSIYMLSELRGKNDLVVAQ